MPRNSKASIAGLVILIGLAGCAAPIEAVSVNEAQVLSTDVISSAPDPTLPRPPASVGPAKVTVPGFAPGYLSDPSLTREQELRTVIERQQREARRTLERRLRAVYADQVRQFELSVRRDVEEQRSPIYNEANRQIRLRFQRYADARVPLISRLYDIVGFPDPNPRNEPPKTKLGAVSQQLFDEAAELRRELGKVESAYREDKEQLLRQADDQASAIDAGALKRVREMADRLETQATNEANRQIRVSVKDLGLQLVEPRPMSLPATPPVSVSLPAERAPAPAPQVPSSGVPSGVEDRRRRLQHELKIWLGTHRYRLTDNGRDATAEFLTWRKSYRAGP